MKNAKKTTVTKIENTSEVFSDSVVKALHSGTNTLNKARYRAGVEAKKAGLNVTQFREEFRKIGLTIPSEIASKVYALLKAKTPAGVAVPELNSKVKEIAKKAKGDKGKGDKGKGDKGKGDKGKGDKVTLTAEQVTLKWLTVQVKKGVVTPEMTIEELLGKLKASNAGKTVTK